MALGKEQPRGWLHPCWPMLAFTPSRRKSFSPLAPAYILDCGGGFCDSFWHRPRQRPAQSLLRHRLNENRLLVADRHRPDPAPPDSSRFCYTDRDFEDALSTFDQRLRYLPKSLHLGMHCAHEGARAARFFASGNLPAISGFAKEAVFWLSRKEYRHARLSLPHVHARPQHGRRPRPVARHRHEGRRFRQADHRHRQLLHPVRARPRAPEGPRPAGRARGRGGGRHRQGVQHHRGRRRHRDGPRRHALFAALARTDRRQRRVHGQRALRRRAGLHLQLRQDHARHADGGAAPEHPRRVRLRRPDGGGQGRDRTAR